MCDRWKEFSNFYEDAHDKYEQNLYPRLINPILHYSPENCDWVTKQELYQIHGMSRTKFYRIWSELIHSKANPKSKDYKGISVCDCWYNFALFNEDMSKGYEEGKILKLLDFTQSYSQENCYWDWAWGKQQAHPLFGTPLYTIWRRTVNEYCNPKSNAYNGSEICDRWRDFVLFCEDMASTYEKAVS